MKHYDVYSIGTALIDLEFKLTKDDLRRLPRPAKNAGLAMTNSILQPKFTLPTLR